MQDEVLLVFSTFPDAETAERIANDLVNAKLAACVNILPAIKSIYRWQEKIANVSEVLAILKTTAARFPELQRKLRAAHPYDVPEIIGLPISNGLPEYVAWVSENCAP